MKMCELSSLYTGYIEVYEFKGSTDGVCIYDHHPKLHSVYCNDQREILQIIPVSECEIRAYVKEA
ncbi:MAG: hypothetical protein [Bacteriophage sp.]|nr:MAG: hypothetical protein [Bacteriophage sp.]